MSDQYMCTEFKLIIAPISISIMSASVEKSK